jgi:hypothetical protein
VHLVSGSTSARNWAKPSVRPSGRRRMHSWQAQARAFAVRGRSSTAGSTGPQAGAMRSTACRLSTTTITSKHSIVSPVSQLVLAAKARSPLTPARRTFSQSSRARCHRGRLHRPAMPAKGVSSPGQCELNAALLSRESRPTGSRRCSPDRCRRRESRDWRNGGHRALSEKSPGFALPRGRLDLI